MSAITGGIQAVSHWLDEGPLNLSTHGIGGYVQRLTQFLQRHWRELAGGIIGGAVFLLELIGGLILAMFLTFFFVKDGDRIAGWLLSQVHPNNRGHYLELARRSWNVLSAYIRGTALVGLIDAVGIGLSLFLIGVPLVVPLSVLVFFGAFFPIVGATVAGIVSALVALVSGGWLDSVLVIGATLVVQQLEGNVLQPLILGRSLSLHPVAVVLALTAGAVLGGIAGAFLAVPSVAIVGEILAYIREHRSDILAEE